MAQNSAQQPPPPIPIPGDKDGNGNVQYAIPGLPLQVSFPPGWVMRPPAENQGLYFIHPGHDDWRDLSVDIEDFTDMDSLQQEVQQSWTDLHQQYKNVQDIKPPKVKKRFIVYSYKYTDDDGTVIRAIDLVVALPRLQSALFIEASTPNAAFQQNAPELVGILKSVKRQGAGNGAPVNDQDSGQ